MASTTTPPPQSAGYSAVSQFAALEPSWAASRTRGQLRTLLVLGALFNRRLFVHDTQLADSPHLIADFAGRNERILSLYSLLTGLIEADVVSVALRDGTYDAARDTLLPCRSLSELVASWQQRDPASSWVIRPDSEPRLAIVRDLDELLQNSANSVTTYPYREIKQDFMKQVRTAFWSDNGRLKGMVTAQGGEFQRRYESILNLPWFSHSNIFSLIQESNLDLDHALAQTHGVFDEAAYARWRNSRLLGCEWSEADFSYPERLLAGLPREGTGIDPGEELDQHAMTILEGQGANLVGTLTAEEVVGLRESAREVFLLQELFETTSSAPDIALARALAEASGAYWEEISRYLSRTRPHLAREPTRLAIFLRSRGPRLARAAEHYFSMGLSALVRVALALTPGVKNIDSNDRASIARRVSLDFVFYRNSESIKSVRRSVPLRGWVSLDERRDLPTASPPTRLPGAGLR